jgi:hypothetical protein
MDPRVLAYLPLVSPVATLIVVIVGVLFSNRHVDTRVSDLQNYLQRYMDARFEAERRIHEANFRLLLSKIEDIDTRLTRLEERFAR